MSYSKIFVIANSDTDSVERRIARRTSIPITIKCLSLEKTLYIDLSYLQEHRGIYLDSSFVRYILPQEFGFCDESIVAETRNDMDIIIFCIQSLHREDCNNVISREKFSDSVIFYKKWHIDASFFFQRYRVDERYWSSLENGDIKNMIYLPVQFWYDAIPNKVDMRIFDQEIMNIASGYTYLRTNIKYILYCLMQSCSIEKKMEEIKRHKYPDYITCAVSDCISKIKFPYTNEYVRNIFEQLNIRYISISQEKF